MANRLRSFAELGGVPLASSVVTLEPVFFVLRRQNAQWSLAAMVMSVHASEIEAETAAQALKRQAVSGQHFGVAALRSEAREASVPVEIVRVPMGDAA